MSRVLSPYMIGSGSSVRRQKAYTKDDLARAKFLFRVLFLVAFTAILCLFYIWSRVQILHYGYEINSLKNYRYELTEQNKNLKLEAATLSSPRRLERIATERLSMRSPVETQVKVLDR
jgi:cell division protein FtsL